jgi:hypothetical protein
MEVWDPMADGEVKECLTSGDVFERGFVEVSDSWHDRSPEFPRSPPPQVFDGRPEHAKVKSDADAVYDLNPAFVIQHISVAEGTLWLSLLETISRLGIRAWDADGERPSHAPDRSLLSASLSEHHR